MRALWRARNHRGPYEVAVSLYELGRRYNKINRFSKSVPMLEEALSIQRTIEQPDRRFTGRILAELASSYYMLSQAKDQSFIEKGKPLVQELRNFTELFSGQERSVLNKLFTYYEIDNI